jgi:Bacterial protein of unknown function (DUF916)
MTTLPTFRRRYRLATAVALAFAAVTALAAPAAALAAEGDRAGGAVTWTVRTAFDDLGADRTSYKYVINPGTTVEDGLVIANRGTEPLDLALYAADGFTTDSGQIDLLAAGEKSVGIGTWAHTDAERVTVAAGTTATVPFTVVIPANATPGDYAGGIVTSLTEPSEKPGVNVDRRLGIRMNVRVSGDLRPSLVVEDAQVTWSGGLNPFVGGDATVTYTLHNTGNVALSAQQATTVGGPFAWFATDADQMEEPPQLLPGETWTQTATVPAVALLVLLNATASVTPLMTDASGSTTPLAPITATAVGWTVPWALLVVVILIVLLVVFMPRLLKKRWTLRQAREDARVAAAITRALEDAEQPKETASVGT